MKILFVVRSMGYGGASKQLAMTANGIVRYGHDVYIYIYQSNTCEQQLDSRVKLIHEDKPPKNTLQEYLFTPYRLYKHVKDIHVSLVVGWRTNAGCASVLATKCMKDVCCVFSERTDPYMENNWKLKFAKFVCDKADGAVFQTERAQNYYKRLKNKSVVIPNPIDVNTVFPDIVDWQNRKCEIVCVGRFFNKQKRFDILLKAFCLVHKKIPELILTFYGSGEDLKMIKQLTCDYNIEKYVCFKGVVNNVVEQIKTAKVFVLSSDYEGIPNVIIEAFIAGVPVVTTDTSPGGARVLVEDENNGFVVPIRDYCALAEKICEVISNRSVADSFICRSRDKLKLFTSDKIFSKWNDYLLSFQ